MPHTQVATCAAQGEPTSSLSSLWQSLPGSLGEASAAGFLLRSLPHWAAPSVPGEVRVLGCGGRSRAAWCCRWGGGLSLLDGEALAGGESW